GRFPGAGHGAVGGRAHHLERGADHLPGDPHRRLRRHVLHGDGLVSGEPELAIRVRGLRNSFGSQVVHDQLDLDVRRGEILGVVGGSGTGKSVLMRAILGLRPPQAGSIEVLGVDALSWRARESRLIERNTGVLFQGGALFSSLTVAENVAVPLKEHYPELPADMIQDLAMLKIRMSGLPEDAGAKLP